MSLFARVVRGALAIVLATAAAVSIPSGLSSAAVLPSGFQEQIVFAGLDQPTNIEFAPDRRVFVAEKKGVVKVYDNLANPAPTVFADLSSMVNSQWDRGLLGLALNPNFAADPWVYVLYTYDAPPGQVAPIWNDSCSNPSAGNCLVTARLSRLKVNGNHMAGTEQVLVQDWCQQYASHSIGDLHFGADGALYVSAGEGASYTALDYGQLSAATVNPCGDPPAGVGGAMVIPTAEGGSLRAQDVRTTGDPAGLDGAVLRLNPTTGQAMTDNPLASSTDVNARRIVAHGFRNPFRFTVRPGTNELWVGDVGSTDIEEINRVVTPTAGVTNFGWPCFEGPSKKVAWANQGLNLCTSLYSAGGQTDPYYRYSHGGHVVATEGCSTAGGSTSGLAFYPNSGGPYPAMYQGALFFADYTRNCIWAMKAPTPGGLPNPALLETFVTGAANPVDLSVGPGDELYYADLGGGTIRRIRYFAGNQPPTAVISSSSTGGAAPLTVNFDGTGSSDPDPSDLGRLTYAWDFDGNGTVDSTSPVASFTYTTEGVSTVSLTVTDTLGSTGTTTLSVTPGNDAPTAVIDTPVSATTWRVGDQMTFSGHATDLQDGDLPGSALRWRLRMQHCATLTSCHVHSLQEWQGVVGGSFVAPDHEYPSYLELELTATDSAGLTHSVVRRLDPMTVDLTFASNPPGLTLAVGDFAGTAPFTRTVIQGSNLSISAGSPQIVGVTSYTFAGWSDGKAAAHIVTAPPTATVYTANYNGVAPINLALNKPATGSASCGADETPAKAVNGSWTGGSKDKWCSTTAPRWLQVDLGSVSSIGTFVVRHSGAGGEAAIGNTKDFNIQVSPDAANWTTVVTVAGNTADVTTHPVTTTGRFVRLNVTTPTNNGTAAARIYEFEVLAPPAAPPTTPPPTSTSNLALNKTATGSASCSASEGPAKAVNGSWTGGNTDKWCSTVAPRWLQVDLGSVSNIGSFVVRHSGAGGEAAIGNTRDFNIQVSSNGTNWTTAVTITGNTADVTTSSVATTGRYVRLNITTPTSNGTSAARVYEFEVLAPVVTPPSTPPPTSTSNLALNKFATSSTSCGANEGPAKAVNGSWTAGSTDKWCSTVAPRWLQVDLGSVANISSFVVRHSGAGGEAAIGNTKDFNIQVSSDGTNWTTVVTVAGNTADVTTNPVTTMGRYVRLNVTTPTNNSTSAARIYEFEVMGTPR